MRLNLKSSSDHETLSFAARELARYLRRMLPGCEADIGGGEDADMTFCLSVSDDRTDEDAYRVEIGPEGGSILGSNERSVLLGAYDYLKRLGCRFLGPDSSMEAVPVISASELPARYEKKAFMKHRGVCIEGADSPENIKSFIGWLPKIGMNSFFLQFKTPYAFIKRWYSHEGNPLSEPSPYTPEDAVSDAVDLEREIRKRGLKLHKGGHGWTGEVLGYDPLAWEKAGEPPDGEHIGMAAMVNGKRDWFEGIPANTNLCMSSDEAIERFSDLIAGYAADHPEADYLHVWLSDMYNTVCECAECRKTTLSDQYVSLLNKTDKKLSEKGLGTKIVFLLYQELLWPPLKERLENPERFVLMFAPISRSFEKSYAPNDADGAIPEYKRNRITLPESPSENLAFLGAWQQVFKGDGFLYDYPLGRAHYGDAGYVRTARVIAGDIKQLKNLGLNGYISCQELRAALPNALPDYVMGHMLFDENADADELIGEYFKAAYGSRADAVLEYLSSLSALSSPDYVNAKGERINPDIARRMDKIYRLARDFEAPGTGIFPKLLRYHREYTMALSEALKALAEGDTEEAAAAKERFYGLIREREEEFQPYLDVYRVTEVLNNYTFKLKNIG